MNVVPYAIIAVVGLQRIAEVVWAQGNTTRLKARGAVEAGARHYPFIVALHAAWLVAMTMFLPTPKVIHPAWLALFLMLQLGRCWILWTLGPYFTTRIITLPGTALVRGGPYRYVRHPNYLVVFGEIFVLPLAFGEVLVAIVFTILNAMMLAWRVRAEDAALATRRSAL
jgi:methyltransferase